MWTDGRYFLQAQRQLEQGWTMMKIDVGEPQYFEWAVDNLPAGTKIGVDPNQIPAGIPLSLMIILCSIIQIQKGLLQPEEHPVDLS
jgi:Xaa-Pro aminopeptidase